MQVKKMYLVFFHKTWILGFFTWGRSPHNPGSNVGDNVLENNSLLINLNFVILLFMIKSLLGENILIFKCKVNFQSSI